MENKALHGKRKIILVIDFGPSDTVEVQCNGERRIMSREKARMLPGEGNRVIWVVGVSPKKEPANVHSHCET